jgi:hypothetical protein
MPTPKAALQDLLYGSPLSGLRTEREHGLDQVLLASFARTLTTNAQALGGSKERQQLETTYEWWVRTMFPTYFSTKLGAPIPFAARHHFFWRWIWRIRLGQTLPAAVVIWPRGSGKSTGCEIAMAATGALGTRRYGWYVSGSQDQADKHVQNIASLLEDATFAQYYPLLAERAVGKYGNSKGWRRNRVRSSSGFTVDAMGLDSASRGLKVDRERPDFIILDDVDSAKDSIAEVGKKIETLTKDILPAGSDDAVVLFAQNLIHYQSIAARLVDLAEEPADFLSDRLVDGPHPALIDPAYEQRWVTDEMGRPRRKPFIVAGTPTWEGQDLERCQALLFRIGLRSFEAEVQHEDVTQTGGLFDNLEFRYCAADAIPWEDMEDLVVWVDPAITKTDRSDSQAISVMGRAGSKKEGDFYAVWQWEKVATPRVAIRLALLVAIRYGASRVGVETDQGGEAWQSVYDEAWQALIADDSVEEIDVLTKKPRFVEAKAGSIGSKSHRASIMLADYEKGRFVHVLGSHRTLEKALRRYLKTKPYDLCLAAGTMVLTERGEVAIELVRPGDRVLTRYGWKSVRHSGRTAESATIYRLPLSNGRVLEGTGNHPVWTENRGWVPLMHTSVSDRLRACPQRENPSSSTAFYGTGTRTPNSVATAPTTPPRKEPFIRRSTSALSAPFRTVLKSTTSLQTTYRTLLRRSTPMQPKRRTARSILGMFRRRSDSTWSAYGQRRLSGTRARRGETSIAATLDVVGRVLAPVRWCAPFVAHQLSLGILAPSGTAPGHVQRRPMERKDATKRSDTAWNAKSPSWPTNTTTNAGVAEVVPCAPPEKRTGRAAVYNLEVEGAHEYYANGVLVHNCDAHFWAFYDLSGKLGDEPDMPAALAYAAAKGSGWSDARSTRMPDSPMVIASRQQPDVGPELTTDFPSVVF